MAVIRRTEVFMVLFVDIIFYSLYPNEIAIIGHCIVLLSSVGMVFAPAIEEKLCPSKLVKNEGASNEET